MTSPGPSLQGLVDPTVQYCRWPNPQPASSPLQTKSYCRPTPRVTYRPPPHRPPLLPAASSQDFGCIMAVRQTMAECLHFWVDALLLYTAMEQWGKKKERKKND